MRKCTMLTYTPDTLAHTGATHLSFTVAITYARQLIPESRIRRAHGLRARIMSEASELKQRFYSCIAPSAARDCDMLSV